MIRHFLHVNPYQLTPKEFATHWREAELLMLELKPFAADRL
ncbi:hypothetical protein [Spirosoma aerolatum]|nr:hypothetical protein [Spirosoma aerolatum]